MDNLEQQKLDALAEFAAGAGHEINNPLTIINGRTQLLLQEISNPEHRKQLETIVQQVHRIYDMIADVRFFARPPEPEIETFDLKKEFQKLIKEQKAMMRAANINLRFKFEDDSQRVKIKSDPVLLHHAVAMLCRNAVESVQLSRRESGDISLRVWYEKRHWIVEVGDNGAGISDEAVPHLFDPYYSGREAGRGLGFGLTKVWRIMRLLGGEVRYERLQNGAKFILLIPFVS